MKKLFGAILIIVFCGSVYAENMFGVGGYFGATSTGDLGDGNVCGLNMDFEVAPFVMARMSFGYMTSFDVEDYDTDSFIGFIGNEFELDDIDIGSFELGVFFKFDPIDDIFSLYCGAGFAAYYIPDIDIYGRNFREDVALEFDPVVGLWCSAGVEIGHPNFKFFAEVKAAWADNSNVDIVVDNWYLTYYGDVAVDLSNVQVLAGLKIEY